MSTLDKVLLFWADEIVCMTADQAPVLVSLGADPKKIIVLGIEDSFRYRDPELIQSIRKTYDAAEFFYKDPE